MKRACTGLADAFHASIVGYAFSYGKFGVSKNAFFAFLLTLHFSSPMMRELPVRAIKVTACVCLRNEKRGVSKNAFVGDHSLTFKRSKDNARRRRPR